MDDIFAAQCERERAILSAWHDGAFATELAPYFRWKEGGQRVTRDEVRAMRQAVSRILDPMWNDPQANTVVRDYYVYIEEELDEIAIMYHEGVIR